MEERNSAVLDTEEDGCLKDAANTEDDMPPLPDLPAAGQNTASDECFAGWHGAVSVVQGMNAGFTLALEEKRIYYINRVVNCVLLSQAPGPHCIGQLVFRDDLQEYAVAPRMLCAVALDNGQWIGMKGDYYLPRGMKLIFPGFRTQWVLE